MIGENLPVPLPSLLRSVRELSSTHLGEIAGEAGRLASVLTDSPNLRVDLVDAWPAPALLAYGVAASREQLSRDGYTPAYEMQVALVVPALVQLQAPNEVLVTVGRGSRGKLRPVRVRWRDPGWMGMPELHARHRAALLCGTVDSNWYAARGWRLQLRVEGGGGADLTLPPCGELGPRWTMDTERDWRTSRKSAGSAR